MSKNIFNLEQQYIPCIKKYSTIDRLLKDYPRKAKREVECPNCGEVCKDISNQMVDAATPVTFSYLEGDQNWYEGNDCKCGTKFYIHNGT